MIIVMDNGTWQWPANVPQPKPGERQSGPWPPMGWADNFMKTLLDDIIPMIDSNYRTLADQKHRAISWIIYGWNANSDYHFSTSRSVFSHGYF